MSSNFDCNQALQYILKKANAVGLNNAQLIEGLCDHSNFSKMCTGKRKPNYDLIIQLSQKLNISLHELQIHSSYKNPEEYLILSKKFQELRVTGNFSEMKKLYISYLAHDPNPNNNVQHLLCWMQGIYEANLNRNYIYAIDLFSKSIKLIQPLFLIEQLNLDLLTVDQLDLIHDICLCYMNLGKHSQAIVIYQQLISHLENQTILEDYEIISKYCYTVGKISLIVKAYDQAKFYSLKGIEYCSKNYNLARLPFLYCNLAIYEQVFNNTEQANQYLTDALFLFKQQNRPLSFYKGLNEFIKKYEFQVDFDALQLNI
ncbi:MAG TPA: hypothetical protein DCY20_05480 [Firmicutes bacterium]|nr:hypothetical protein [Bacillota bacterium]